MVDSDKVVKFQKSLLEMQTQQLFKDVLEAEKKKNKDKKQAKAPSASSAPATKKKIVRVKNRQDRRKELRK